MEKIKTFAFWQSYEDRLKSYVLSLRDVRNVGMLAFVVMVLLISWSGIKAIQTNYGLEKQVQNMQRQNEISKLKNSNLALENEYLNTSQYLEVAARQNFGLAKPGETVLLVPDEVALKHTVPEPVEKDTANSAKRLPAWQTNFRDWMSFFLHRG